VWSRSGRACRIWLYWSSIVCVGSSVSVVGDGDVECSLVELGESSLGLVVVGGYFWCVRLSGRF
jgi:hypothetical protein